MSALARLDHLLYTVPDIRAAHADCLRQGFREAWPVGPFWPGALTSGIALGGFNVEYIQPDRPSSAVPQGLTLAFEPTSLDLVGTRLRECGVAFEVFEKVETSPALLRLRGFPADEAQTPQLICTNLLPIHRDDLPFDFFICDYSPFLRSWLSPEHPRLQPAGESIGRVVRVEYGTPSPGEAKSLLDALGYQGDVEIKFQLAEVREVVRILRAGDEEV